MLLNEPGRTDFDFTFNLFGFEVRTNALFFVLPLLLGQGFISTFGDVNPGVGMLVVAAVFWISVLVHELGHAFAFRYFGIDSRIVLYWMGGLAIPSGAGSWAPRKSLNPIRQIIISLAGPLAGFLLAGIMCLLVWSLHGSFAQSTLRIIPLPLFGESSPIPTGGVIHLAFWTGIIINIILNLFNLVPIFPLDGGQVARQVMVIGDPWNGIRNSLILSIVACIGMVLLTIQTGSYFLPIFFGLMAYSNFQELQGSRW